MVLHELTTNAVKYGALTSPDGRIDLVWTEAGGRVRLVWTERTAHPVIPPTRKGFGSKMIELSVRHDLKGAAATAWAENGLAFTVEFDMD